MKKLLKFGMGKALAYKLCSVIKVSRPIFELKEFSEQNKSTTFDDVRETARQKQSNNNSDSNADGQDKTKQRAASTSSGLYVVHERIG